jgi:hypothetical protein
LVFDINPLPIKIEFSFLLLLSDPPITTLLVPLATLFLPQAKLFSPYVELFFLVPTVRILTISAFSLLSSAVILKLAFYV